MPGDEPIFEGLQGGQKPIFDEKEVKARRARTHQNPSSFSGTGRSALPGISDTRSPATLPRISPSAASTCSPKPSIVDALQEVSSHRMVTISMSLTYCFAHRSRLRIFRI